MKITKLEALKAKLDAVEILEERIDCIKKYDFRTPNEDGELDEYDKEQNAKTQKRIEGLQYIIEEIVGG